MALRASYYGLKKKWARKINNDNIIPDNASIENQLALSGDFKAVYDYEVATGSKNIAPPLKTATISGITFTVDDIGRVTMSGTATAAALLSASVTLYPGINYILHGRVSSNVWVGLQDPSTFAYVANTQNADNIGFSFADLTPTPKTYRWVVRVASGEVLDNVIIEPQIVISNFKVNPDVYAPNALTNRDLTVKMQGILAAAASSSDFTTFKSKLAAL